MPRKESSRKYLLTINNPTDHGFTHDRIRAILNEFSGVRYWCMCDEVGEQGTPHTHVYVVFANSVMFDTMHKRFYGVHIDKANGSNQENRDYVRKEGKWQDDAKHETNKPETFEEFGELPPDRTKSESQAERIVQLIRAGKTNAEILEECPTTYNKMAYIEQTRQTLLEDQYKNAWRSLEVTYIWGESGAGKTRSVMEQYGYSNVFRVTNYDNHPFDGYKGQDVVVFEEFRGGIKIQDMLNYLDGYPVMLPCRYADRVACYTKVYLISNIPLESQYRNVQVDNPETWAAFRRRIHSTIEMSKQFEELPFDPDFDPDGIFGNKGVS